MTARDIDVHALAEMNSSYGVKYPRGRVIFREGDTSNDMYVVLDGSVGLTVRDPDSGEARLVRLVTRGEFFGEISCFLGRSRSATAIAAEDAVLLTFSRDAAIQMLRTRPRFAVGVIQTLCDRIVRDGETIVKLGGQPNQ